MTRKARSANQQLTLKQRRFLKEYLRNGGNGVQAALAVYDTESYFTANSIARANLQKPPIREAIKRELEQYDVNPKTLVKTLAERLNDDSRPALQLAAWDRAMALLGWDPSNHG